MDKIVLKNRIQTIKTQRESLVKLLEKPDLDSLKTDVIQALEELDELIEEWELTFNQN